VLMKKSSSHPLYNNNRTHVQMDEYLTMDCDFNKARLITQLRSNVPEFSIACKNIKLNGIKNKYDAQTSAIWNVRRKRKRLKIFFMLRSGTRGGDLRRRLSAVA